MAAISSDSETMVTGKRSSHVAAVVAGVDADFTQRPTGVARDDSKRRKEVSGALQQHESHDGHHQQSKPHQGGADAPLPKKMIIYYDGPSKKQFKTCREGEYRDIQAALTKVYSRKEQKPDFLKLLLMCTFKRHHTRLFPVTDKSDREKFIYSGQKLNPCPGCMIDNPGRRHQVT